MPDASSPSDSRPGSSSEEPEATRPRRWMIRLVWGIGGLVGTVLVLTGLLLLVLQTETGATAAAQFLARQVNPLPQTTLSVERASGSWIRSLRLTNVSLTRTEEASGQSVTMAHLDTLAVRYRLSDLLRGRAHLTGLTVRNPSVTMRQAADSTWDWGRKMPASDRESKDTGTVGPVRIDRVAFTGGQLRVHFWSDDRDSTAHIQNLDLRAHALTLGPSMQGHLDTLGLRGHLPTDTTGLRVGAKGRLSPSRVRIDTLHLTSQRSRVRGRGSARLPGGPDDTFEDAFLSLKAQPLALRDLTAFVPTLDVDPRESVTLRARLTGTETRMALTTEATFSGGGRLTVRAEGTPRLEATPGGSGLYYELDADLRDLTTSLMGPLDATQNVISGRISGSLRGPDLSSLSGTVQTRLTDTHLSGVRTPSLRLRSDVEDGTARVRLEGILNGTTVSAQGSVRPFDEAPSMDLTADVRDLSLSTLLPTTGIQGVLQGTAHIRGRAMTTPQATYDGDVTLGPSRLNAQAIRSGQLSVGLGPDQIDVQGTLRFPTGRLQATGRARLGGSQRFVLKTAQLDSVDVAALVGDTTGSRVTGTIQAQGTGFTPQTARGTGTIRLRASQYGRHHIEQFDSSVRFETGTVTTNTRTQVNGGTWRLQASSQPFAPVPSMEITQGRFRNVDIGPVLHDSTQSSALHGTLQGRVQGTTPETLRLQGSVTLDTSRVNQQQIAQASAQITIQDSTLQSTFGFQSPGGRAQFAVRSRPFDAVPSYRMTKGTFENLDLGSIAGSRSVSTQLSGSLTATAQGRRLSDLTAQSDLILQESTVNQAALPQGQLTLSSSGGRLRAEGELAIAGGSLRVKGHLDSLQQTPSYSFRTTARSLDLGALAGWDSLRAHVEAAQWRVDGRGTTLDRMQASTQVSTTSLRLGRLRIDSIDAAGSMERGLLRVDTLTIASNAAALGGKGPVAITQGAGSSNFSFRATVSDAAPLRRLVGIQRLQLRTGRFEARIYGPPNEQQFDGTGTLDGLLYENMQLSDVRLSFNGRRGTTQPLEHLNVEGETGYFSVSGVTGRRMVLDLLYDGTSADLSTDLHLNNGNSAKLRASIRPHATPIPIQIRRLDLRVGPDRWSLQRETTVSIGEAYDVDRLLLHSGSQQIAVDGTIAPSGTQSLIVTAEAVRLDDLAPLVGLPGLGGDLTGTFTLTGKASAPRAEGRLDLTLRTEGSRVGTLHLEGNYHDFALSFNARLAHMDGSALTATGSLPMDLRLQASTPANVSDRPVRLNASTEGFSINWIDPFIDPATMRSVAGTVTGSVEVRGTSSEPELSGTVSVARAGATLPALGTTYRNGTFALRLSNDEITLTEASVETTNGGTLRASGTVGFPELTVGEYNLDLSASELMAVDTEAYRRVVVNGDVKLRGTTRHPSLAGKIQVERGSVYYSEAFADAGTAATQVSLSAEDQLILEERFGRRLTPSDTTSFDFYEAAALDLTVEMERDTWLRSTSTPEMNVQFSGDLDVQKEASQDPQIYGTISVIEGRSTIRQFGQEFQITEGTLTFNGDPYTPSLDLTAVYEKRARETQTSEVQITLTLTGRPDELTPSLSSEPPMSTRNILSYLATGRPADDLLGGDSGEGSLATQLAIGQAASYVENLAASELGLDVVRIEVRTGGTSYLTLGRHLTPRFFVSVEQPVITPSRENPYQPSVFIPDLTLEYQLTDYLLLRSLTGQQSLQLHLLFEYAY